MSAVAAFSAWILDDRDLGIGRCSKISCPMHEVHGRITPMQEPNRCEYTYLSIPVAHFGWFSLDLHVSKIRRPVDMDNRVAYHACGLLPGWHCWENKVLKQCVEFGVTRDVRMLLLLLLWDGQLISQDLVSVVFHTCVTRQVATSLSAETHGAQQKPSQTGCQPINDSHEVGFTGDDRPKMLSSSSNNCVLVEFESIPHGALQVLRLKRLTCPAWSTRIAARG